MRFQGQFFDSESGLHYNFQRYYDPEIGQYLSPDPIGLTGGTRSYGYPHNPLSWSDPLGLQGCAAQLRSSPGTATGGKALPDISGRWLRGSHGNAGRMPGQVADRLRGRTFKDFGEFREAFWQEVGNDPSLSSQFSRSNQTLMRAGKTPAAVLGQSYGGQNGYVLHHIDPIQHGGGVYDLDNILVATPRFHAEVLSPSYHFGGG
jgi:RHS repeat-associated protein